jgi:Tfp pilus assembly protein PilF
MDADERYREGIRLADCGDLGGAFVAFEKAVELNPNHAPTCKQLAKLSLAANERRAFTNWCHEAMRLDESDPEPHAMMAEVLAAAKRFEEAADEQRIADALSRTIDPTRSA